MDLKELLGEAYKEGMTFEEVQQALKDKELVDKSTLPPMVEKTHFDKASSELAEYKKRIKELEQKDMTDQQLLQAELDKAKEAQKQYAVQLSRVKAEEAFVKAGLNEKQYKDLLDSVANEDLEATLKVAKSITNLVTSTIAETDKKVRAEVLKDTPTPPSGEGTPGMTIDKFRELSLPEKAKFAQENPEAYNQLF